MSRFKLGLIRQGNGFNFRKGTNDERRINQLACCDYDPSNRNYAGDVLRMQDDAKQNDNRNQSAGRLERNAVAVNISQNGVDTMNRRKVTLEELILRCMIDEHDSPSIVQFKPVQLMTLVDTALVLQERIWILYGFKFLATFIVYGLSDDLEAAEAIQLARKLRNADDDDKLFIEFYWMLQACYIDSLEGGDE